MSMLGEPRVEGPAGAIAIPVRKAQALLFFLASQPGRAFPRSRLAGLLWDERPEAEGRANLSTALSRLRRLLPLLPLRTDRDSLAWDPAAAVLVDTAEFQRLVAAGAPDQAEALVRGPFLEDVSVPASPAFEDWLAAERHGWRDRWLLAVQAADERDAADGRWAEVARRTARALAAAPLDERLHRWRMRALAATGERAAAMAEYDELCRQLAEEVGADPERETVLVRRQLLAGGAAASPPHPPPPLAPWVGRDREVARIGDAVRSGVRAILIRGEAGVGKSRLLDEAGRQLAHPPALGRCRRGLDDIPLAPWAEALAALDERAGTRTSRQLQLGESPPPPALLAMADALAASLARLPEPIPLALEDVHEADAPTWRMLEHLLWHRLAPAAPLLLTARAGELEEGRILSLRELERAGRLLWLDLGPLDPAAVRRLVAHLRGVDDAETARWVHARSRGNPLFAIELLAAGDHAGATVGVQVLIRQRIARLDADTGAFLRAAAICGEAMEPALPARVAGLADSLAIRAASAATRAGMLVEQGEAGRPGLRWRHALVREAILASMTEATRTELHARAYRHLLRAPATGPPRACRGPDVLALHAAAGGLWAEAVRCNLAAAAAPDVAPLSAARARFLDRALSAAERLPPGPHKRRRCIDIRILLAAVLRRIDPERLRGWLEATAAEAARAADGSHLVRLRALQANLLLYRERLADAATLTARIEAVARRGGDPTLLAVCERVRALRMQRGGDLRAAISALAVSIRLDLQAGNAAEALGGRLLLAAWLALAGEFRAAEALVQRLYTAARGHGDLAAQAHALSCLACCRILRGDLAGAVAADHRALALAAPAAVPGGEALLTLRRGIILSIQGSHGAAIAAQREAIALAERRGWAVWRAHCWSHMAAIRLAAGDAPAAAHAAATAIRWAERTGDRYVQALALRFRGLATDSAPDIEEALRMFALMGARPDAARCHADLVELLPDPAGALRHRDLAMAMFAALGMRAELRRRAAS